MTTTMSMRERREKIEQLVQQNPRVQACAHTFNEAKGNSPTMKAIRPGYLVAKQYVKDGRKLGTPYARFTTKGLNWFIRRYIYGLNQPTLEGTEQ